METGSMWNFSSLLLKLLRGRHTMNYFPGAGDEIPIHDVVCFSEDGQYYVSHISKIGIKTYRKRVRVDEKKSMKDQL